MNELREQLKAERRELMATMHFAFAMGHGCSMGFMPTETRAVLVRYERLNARIAELSD